MPKNSNKDSNRKINKKITKLCDCKKDISESFNKGLNLKDYSHFLSPSY